MSTTIGSAPFALMVATCCFQKLLECRNALFCNRFRRHTLQNDNIKHRIDQIALLIFLGIRIHFMRTHVLFDIMIGETAGADRNDAGFSNPVCFLVSSLSNSCEHRSYRSCKSCRRSGRFSVNDFLISVTFGATEVSKAKAEEHNSAAVKAGMRTFFHLILRRARKGPVCS